MSQPIATQLSETISTIKQAKNGVPLAAPHVTLLAVSKGQGEEKVIEALKNGQKDFAENRVQEALEKFSPFKERDENITLHLIGPLQTNKVKEAVALFDVIHTVDRLKLAESLAAEMKKQTRNLPCFIQVNTGEEEQKAGVLPQDADKLIHDCKALGLNIIGLMCIPPHDENPAPHFALLRKIAGRNGLSELSMGMSGDYETAIRFGATHVRIGTAIFGERSY